MAIFKVEVPLISLKMREISRVRWIFRGHFSGWNQSTSLGSKITPTIHEVQLRYSGMKIISSPFTKIDENDLLEITSESVLCAIYFITFFISIELFLRSAIKNNTEAEFMK